MLEEEDEEDEETLAQSVRTISALFQSTGTLPNLNDPRVEEPLEARVASISAELAAAIAQAQSRVYGEDVDEDDEDDSDTDMGARETIGPNTSGIRGLGVNEVRKNAGAVSTDRDDEDEDSEPFPMPLRTRKGKDAEAAVGEKRKR